MIVGGWRFINSESFSKDLSIKVSELLLNKTQVDATFGKIDFVAFPPKTILRDLTVKKRVEGVIDVALQVKTVEIDFSLANVISKKLELSSVSISGGKVDLKILDQTESEIDWQKLELKKYFQKYQTILFEDLPVVVDRLNMNDIDLVVDGNRVFVEQFKASLKKRNLRVVTKLKNLEICHNVECKNKELINQLGLNVNWSKDNADLLELNVTQGTSKLNGNFSLANDYQGFLTLSGNTKSNLDLAPYVDHLNKLVPELGKMTGRLETEAKLDGRLVNSFRDLHFKIIDFRSNWIDLDLAEGLLFGEKEILTLKKFSGSYRGQSFSLTKSAAVFDLKKAWFKEGKYSLSLKNMESNNFLKSQSNLEPMKITASGPVTVEYTGKKVIFNLNGTALNELKLQFGPNSKPVLANKNYLLKDFSLTIDQQYFVYLKGLLSDGQLALAIDGKLTDKDVLINVLPKSQLNWQRFGTISGVGLTGYGPVEGKISGPYEKVVFALDVDWNNFQVVDINFGKVVGSFDFDLDTLTLKIHELNGNYANNIYNGKGDLYFGDNSGLDIDLDITKANYLGLIKMLPLIFKNLKMPDFVNFDLSSKLKISGPFETANMIVDGKLKGFNGNIKDEDIDSIEFDYSLKKNILEFNDVLIKKFKASISAWASINLASGFLEFKGKSTGLYLNDLDFYRDLRLGYQGKLDLDFEGNGTKDTLSSRYKLKVSEATIANMSMPGTNVLAFFNGREFTISGNILGNKIKFDSLLSFENKLSSLKVKVDTNEIRDILGVISSHNLSSAKITGKLKMTMDMLFDVSQGNIHKFNLGIQDFFLKKDQMFLKNDPSRSSVLIEDKNIRKWNLRLFGEENTFFESKGFGLTNGDIRIEHRFNLDASLAELFSSYIEKAAGMIAGSSAVVVGKGITVKDFELKSDRAFLKIKELKTPITDLSLRLKKINNDYVLQKLKGLFGEGEIKADGRIVFDNLIPKIQLNYQVDKATLPLFKKSSITFNTSGDLSGSQLPYILKGKVNILHGEFFDDPADFLEEKKVNLNIYSNYLPQEKGLAGEELINLNLQFDITNPVLIKNNLAEVYLKGAGAVTSSIKNPELNLRIEALPNVSKFKFKGNDFSLSQGHVEIRDQGKNRQSDVRFVGVTRLNDYDLKLEISGRVEKVNVNLTSEPPLAQDDLLSLLTLGVTNDISKNLDAGDRRFVTTVGLGTLLVDQFKINEDLNSALGLKLSVLPEFQENETQLIQGKSAVSDSSSSRLKSSTKIKLDKKITNKVDLSVSSTIGGSLEQKQEMNLNFNIDRNWSVEGVYELKATDTEDGNSSNSVGADVKYKWSF